jgi:hypothetical protein
MPLRSQVLTRQHSSVKPRASFQRQGTLRTCRALTRNISMPAASSFWQSAIQ